MIQYNILYSVIDRRRGRERGWRPASPTPYPIGSADWNHCNCNHVSFSESGRFQRISALALKHFDNLWLQSQWFPPPPLGELPP